MLLAEIRKTMALAQESKSLLDEQGQMIVDIRERLIQVWQILCVSTDVDVVMDR